jgi:hypothetical protein
MVIIAIVDTTSGVERLVWVIITRQSMSMKMNDESNRAID